MKLHYKTALWHFDVLCEWKKGIERGLLLVHCARGVRRSRKTTSYYSSKYCLWYVSGYVMVTTFDEQLETQLVAFATNVRTCVWIGKCDNCWGALCGVVDWKSAIMTYVFVIQHNVTIFWVYLHHGSEWRGFVPFSLQVTYWMISSNFMSQLVTKKYF